MKNMKRIFAFAVIQLFLLSSVRADEGMWLPLYIDKVMNNMKTEGCKLKPEQIYNINKSSIKDGIVHFGGFCTGEIVSSQGLVFTNHHCGFDAIANLSTTEHNYMDNGFWAQNATDEIKVPGLTASILVYMTDVTQRVKAAGDSKENKDKVIAEIIAEATKDNGYTAKVESMFYGNEYYLMVHEVFKDIRFVGTPPAAIGKFGGDTDNWMWPRHTCDFSVFRIYAGADNKPADYSPNNKPYTPKYSFPINLKGVQPNDFVMIMGYPGRTTRYLSSSSIESLTGIDYPERAGVLKTKLDMWHEEMEKSVDVRLALSGDYASLMNAQKYYEGAMNAIKHSPCLSQKKILEKGFTDWVNADENRKKLYGTVLNDLDQLEKDNAKLIKVAQYINYGYYGTQLGIFGRNFKDLRKLLNEATINQPAIDAEVDKLKKAMIVHFDGYEKMKMADQKVMAAILRLVQKNLEQEYWIKTLSRYEFTKLSPQTGTGDQNDQFAALIFSTSMLVDSNQMNQFLANPTKDALEKDLGILYGLDLLELRDQYRPKIMEVAAKRTELMKVYVQGLREYQSGKFMYPDANSTLRLTYGQVKSYAPRDGMSYNWYTTEKGILEKEIPGDDEFDVPTALKTLLVNKDFGRYANKKGELPICFLANLDITGGNSGSPVINGKGELVGIAFDGVWEGMVGDIYFDENYNRTISVDIRYVLFIIDKMSHADRIINELKLIE
jgi:hypothetical protein